MNISNEIFTQFRTPDEQSHFLTELNNYIDTNENVKQKARLRKGPFKTMVEEFMPFVWFCESKYRGRKNIECALVGGTEGRDAIIRRKDDLLEHNVEITWPINGKEIKTKMQELNDTGTTTLGIFDSEDTSLHEETVNRIIKIANKKSLRNYRSDGGATLIFVLDSFLFWESNEKHMQILKSLKCKLTEIDFMADNILLILSPEKKIFTIKNTEPAL